MRESSVSFAAAGVAPLGVDAATYRRVFLTEFEGLYSYFSFLGRVGRLKEPRTVSGQTMRWRAWFANRDGVHGWLDFPTRREAVDYLRQEREALRATGCGLRAGGGGLMATTPVIIAELLREGAALVQGQAEGHYYTSLDGDVVGHDEIDSWLEEGRPLLACAVGCIRLAYARRQGKPVEACAVFLLDFPAPLLVSLIYRWNDDEHASLTEIATRIENWRG